MTRRSACWTSCQVAPASALAVAVGASYYSYVRGTGAGVLVRGGLPRAYFLGVENAQWLSEVVGIAVSY